MPAPSPDELPRTAAIALFNRCLALTDLLQEKPVASLPWKECRCPACGAPSLSPFLPDDTP